MAVLLEATIHVFLWVHTSSEWYNALQLYCLREEQGHKLGALQRVRTKAACIACYDMGRVLAGEVAVTVQVASSGTGLGRTNFDMMPASMSGRARGVAS
ncbi:uncharacterized protein B0H18DRAFT_427019 [Fomitopsis serialis]|uniref:uncharacterized protein n=1 Tax=Fomitopsis serialis TaxID=139415 RepID=UPI0020074EDF|nr:uncharacterized protein B0H18DRAFT_427019 [Neoantrodia serialis]KAH9924583.1 hypothetical protein B0H18DRAFT_427019 [Neoantrodia serialis]